jgi:hypothetical protein
VTITYHEAVGKSIAPFGEYIKSEVLADSITLADNEGEETELVEGVGVRILVEKS